MAYDTSNPAQKARAEVTISVTRNENKPVFTKAVYEEEISENFPLGDVIVSVSASDVDADDVIVYEVVESDATAAVFLESFWLDPETGSVVAIRPLADADQTRFEVSFPSKFRMTSHVYNSKSSILCFRLLFALVINHNRNRKLSRRSRSS